MWLNLLRSCSLFALFAAPSLTHSKEIRYFSDKQDLSAAAVQSGFEFLTPESQALQLDEFANPGYLWVDRGKLHFDQEEGQRSCGSCHSEQRDMGLQGAATHFPKLNQSTNELINLEAQINQCRVEQQQLPMLPYESEQLLSLTAYVASLSRGMSADVSIKGAARPYFERGRAYFFERRGQLNLACTQCHDDNWGKLLRGDRISQGHPNAYPGYRLEWQTFGSLHRRIEDCDVGVKAEPFAAGSTVYVELELYLKWRAKTLPLESPGIRR